MEPHARHLLPFDTADLPRVEADFLIIGSGNAGLRAAIELAHHGSVLILSKEHLNEGSTRYAQGGIAVALNQADRVDLHVQDTLDAGAGLCDEAAVRFMVENGIDRVNELLEWGAQFDRDGDKLMFGLEGAHSVRRVVHRGDATGEETQSVLLGRATEPDNVRVLEHSIAVDFLVQDGACVGALILTDNGGMAAVFARATIIASGGMGRLYEYTSNPPVTTGDGVAMALRAGADLADMEFVQFHPTTMCLPGAPAFLISERVRGEGATLLNSFGERFMIEYHEREELAPRDVVSRAIVNEMARTGSTCVFLDVTHRPSDFLQREFPTIFHTCLAHGIEIWRDAIPVQAAAHFLMGGIWTDLETRTTVPGLFACGEAACTMVHGANRLASNSLLEGLVFGHRAGVAAAAYAEGVPRAVLKDLRIAAQTPTETSPTDVASLRGLITRTMWEAVGIRRRGELLDEALQNFAAMPEFIPPTREGIEYGNMRLIAYVVAMAALERTESRGAHFREDHPETDDLRWRRRLFLYRASSGHVATADTPTT